VLFEQAPGTEKLDIQEVSRPTVCTHLVLLFFHNELLVRLWNRYN